MTYVTSKTIVKSDYAIYLESQMMWFEIFIASGSNVEEILNLYKPERAVSYDFSISALIAMGDD